ncbi:hypothetical protein [Streptomyces sp. WAC01280]|uniref:hypothetical protein n=1 Tax=Streptomyces sp. WAC01280 TaxID=2487424 RepID=UPI000F770E60|nr:hypothetical protein [Streptomyces sp. WAC01280]RSS59561.1 hypothetical protein EF909_06700 [Streptomyces sp. WAC01280]
MEITIPGALVDFLDGTSLAAGENDSDPASKATRECLEAGRRGRGRTLIIKPTSTDMLNVISEYAETLLDVDDATRAERDAARLWLKRAGQSRAALAEQSLATAPAVEEQPAPAPTNVVRVALRYLRRPGSGTMTPTAYVHINCACGLAKSLVGTFDNLAAAEEAAAAMPGGRRAVRRCAQSQPIHKQAPTVEQAATAPRDEPSDWWTIMDPASGTEIVRVYGATAEDMTRRAEALPEVRAVIRKHRGFSRRRLWVSELTPAQRQQQAPAAEQAVEADLDARLDRVEQQAATAFDATARAVDAIEHAENVEAAVETVEDAEALYAAQLVTEAEATDGTWRGDWIGEHPNDEPLFPIDRPREQGSLFA